MPIHRSRRLLIAAVLSAAAVVAGCGSDTDVVAVAGPCDLGNEANADVVAFCPQAIVLAEAQFGVMHWPITSVHFRTSMCPPNARCLARLSSESGTVIFTFAVGEPSMVFVHTAGFDRTGPWVAEAPEPLPDWLLEELRIPS